MPWWGIALAVIGLVLIPATAGAHRVGAPQVATSGPRAHPRAGAPVLA